MNTCTHKVLFHCNVFPQFSSSVPLSDHVSPLQLAEVMFSIKSPLYHQQHMPHIFHFWYATALFRPAKSTPKVRKFAIKIGLPGVLFNDLKISGL